MLSKLCTLLLSMFLTFLLTVIYVIYAIYAICVVVIKKLHDLNLPGWYCISVFTPLAVLLIPYLVLAKGNPEINKYGEPLYLLKIRLLFYLVLMRLQDYMS